jgi:murein DD-endopeptidase MepM/ murein hydrolase activator NlpD/dihydroneopterin aldolase
MILTNVLTFSSTAFDSYDNSEVTRRQHDELCCDHLTLTHEFCIGETGNIIEVMVEERKLVSFVVSDEEYAFYQEHGMFRWEIDISQWNIVELAAEEERIVVYAVNDNDYAFYLRNGVFEWEVTDRQPNIVELTITYSRLAKFSVSDEEYAFYQAHGMMEWEYEIKRLKLFELPVLDSMQVRFSVSDEEYAFYQQHGILERELGSRRNIFEVTEDGRLKSFSVSDAGYSVREERGAEIAQWRIVERTIDGRLVSFAMSNEDYAIYQEHGIFEWQRSDRQRNIVEVTVEYMRVGIFAVSDEEYAFYQAHGMFEHELAASPYGGIVTTTSSCVHPGWVLSWYEAEHPHRRTEVCVACGLRRYTGANVVEIQPGFIHTDTTHSHPTFNRCITKINNNTVECGHLIATGSNASWSWQNNGAASHHVGQGLCVQPQRCSFTSAGGNIRCPQTRSDLVWNANCNQCNPPCSHTWGGWGAINTTHTTQGHSQTRTCTKCPATDMRWVTLSSCTICFPPCSHAWSWNPITSTHTPQGHSQTGACTKCWEMQTQWVPLSSCTLCFPPQTRSISLTSGTMTFPAQNVSYSQPAAQSTLITNTGNLITQQLTVSAPAGYQVSLSQTTGFMNNITVSSILVGDTATFWTRPITGLAAGTHTGSVTVTNTSTQSPPLTAQSRAVNFTVNSPVPTYNTIIIVRDNNQNPIVNATVFMYDSQTAVGPTPRNFVSGTTDTQGRAYFNTVSGPTYGFNAHRAGHEKRALVNEVTRAANDTSQHTYTITLRPVSHFTGLGFGSPVISYTPPTRAPNSNQDFGWRYNGGLDFHTGIDLSRYSNATNYTSNTQVRSMASGIVFRAGTGWGGGLSVQTMSTINSTDYFIAYMHLSSTHLSVGINDQNKPSITQNDPIGFVGDSGSPDAIHLHVTVGVNTHDVSKNNRSHYIDPKVFF